MPSQQSSFNPMRTELACHELMTWIEPTSEPPSKIPQPRIHAYSVPERFTPINRIGCPSPSRRRFPDTRIPECAANSEAFALRTPPELIRQASSPTEASKRTRTLRAYAQRCCDRRTMADPGPNTTRTAPATVPSPSVLGEEHADHAAADDHLVRQRSGPPPIGLRVRQEPRSNLEIAWRRSAARV
jgi:hypothetical protein